MMESYSLAKSPQEHHPTLSPVDHSSATLVRNLEAAIQTDSPLHDYWRMLMKRRWTIVLAVAVAGTIATFVSLRMTPLYDSAVRIAVNRENANSLGFKDMPTEDTSDDWDYTVALDTQISVLQSDSLALEVIRSLQLDRNPAFAGTLAVPAGKPGLSQQTSPNTPLESRLLDRFHSSLSVSKVPHTRLIEVHFLSRDPKLSAQVANTVANTYIERNFRDKFDSTMQTSEWLSKQLADLQVKVERSQAKLVDYEKTKGILGIDEKQNIITQKLDQLNKELTEAESDRIQKESLYRLSAAGKTDFGGTNGNSLIDVLRAKEADLSTKRSELSVQFGPAYPKVRELDNEIRQVRANIDSAQAKIANQLRNEYLAAASRESLLRTAFDAQKQQANELNQAAIEYNLLKRDVDTNRQLYEGLLQRLKEASIAAGLRSNNIRIVDSARLPLKPAKPNIPRNIVLSLFFGLLCGVSIAFMQESLDTRVHTTEHATTVTGLPSLGLVPLDSGDAVRKKKKAQQVPLLPPATADAAKIDLVAISRPRSGMAEAYRSIRTSILLSACGKPPQVLLITSSLPQEGKTTTSVNSAVVLAQKGSRVLLVDGDLRRPSVHRAFRLSNRKGLSTLLTASDSADDAMVQIPQVSNLWVLPAGPTPPQPAELLGSSVMSDLIQYWRTQFDHIVIDTPPILSLTDAVLLSVQADSVVLIVRSGKTTKQALRRSRDLLRQVNAKVIGIVVNALDLTAPDQYYYHYGNYGKYYGSNSYYIEEDVSAN